MRAPFLRALSVRQKLWLMLGVVLGVLVLEDVIQLRTLQQFRIGGERYQVIAERRRAVEQLARLLDDLHTLQALMASLPAPHAKDRLQQMLQDEKDLSGAIHTHLTQLLELERLGNAKVIVADAKAIWERYEAAVRTELEVAPERMDFLSIQELLEGPWGRRFERLLDQVETATNTLRFQTQQLEGEAAGAVVWMQRALLVLNVGVGLLLLGFLWTISRSINRPLQRILAAAHLARGGDLTAEFPADGEDELGQLARTLGETIVQLRGMTLTLRTASDRLVQTVEEIARITQSQESSLRRQAVALQQTTVSAQEIRQSSGEAARRAADIIQIIERAAEVGRSGDQALKESFEGIREIRARIEDIVRQTVELGNRASQVGAITEMVEDLAEQSNVLALNAAIEAAKASEQGRGFSVVAHQMRLLATQSKQATVQVQQELQQSESAMQAILATTQQGKARIDAGLVQVNQGEDRLREVVTMMKESSAGVRQIAITVGQQNTGILQLFDTVTELSSTMAQAVRGMTETRQSMTDLEAVVAHLREAVSVFRL